jgi:hypothetical protein
MRKLNIFLLILFLGTLVVLLSSCENFSAFSWWGKKKGNGPPAHAPAYGVRGKCPQATVQVNVTGRGGTAGQIESVKQDANTVIVNITNSNGSITPVTLQRSGNVWIGPKGEQYLSIPTAEQLKPIYGM